MLKLAEADNHGEVQADNHGEACSSSKQKTSVIVKEMVKDREPANQGGWEPPSPPF
jgi:hypothetical protein